MNIYDVLSKVSEIANKHKLIGAYHNGDVYRIMNSADNTYPTVVFTVDKLQDYEDYSTLSCIFFFVDRLTDDEDNKITIQSNGINVINDIVYKLGDYDGISPVTPLQYTFFTEKFGDMCCGVYANVSIQFTNYTKCCNNFNVNTLVIDENGEYILDNIDVVNVNVPDPELESKTVDITSNGTQTITPDSEYGLSEVTINTNVQPVLQNKTVEYTENGEYSVTNEPEYDGLKQVNINVSIPNVSTAVTITENGSMTLTPDSGYYNQVDITTNVQPVLQNKTVEYTENGEYSVTNDPEYYGLIEAKINVSIPNVSTAVTITENGSMTLTPDSGYYNEVTVNTNVKPKLQDTEITITENGSTEISKDDSYDGFGTVLINTNVQPTLQDKEVTITSNGTQTITKDSGYDGLGNVTITTNVNVSEPTAIDISIAENGTFLPNDFGGDYFNRVKVNVLPILQGKEVTITGNGVTTITNDEGFDGLNSVKITTNVAGGGGGSSNPNVITVQNPFTGNKILDSIDKTLDISKWNLQIGAYNRTFEGMSFLNKIILPIDFFYIENRNDLIENYTFSNCTGLAEIENIDKTRISINGFARTFENCRSLMSLDLSYKPEYNYWDMSSVEDIEYMFSGCTSLTSLNIDGWDRAKLSYSQYAFNGCINLGGIIRLSAHNAINNSNMFKNCNIIEEIYYDNDGYDNANPDNEICNMEYFAQYCRELKKASIKGRNIYNDQKAFGDCTNLVWVDMTGCDYSKYMSGNTSTTNIQPYFNAKNIKTLIGDHTLAEVENGDITIYDGLGISKPRFKSYYFSQLSSLRYSSMLALAKGLGQHTYTSTQYIRLNKTAWDNMRNDDDTIPDSNTITARQTTITDLITGKGWRIQTATS